MKKMRIARWFLISLLAATTVAAGVLSASAAIRTRIVVLPFYVEEGDAVRTPGSDLSMHYRRMTGFIENQLVSHNFEVIDPFARDASEAELNNIMEKATEDSMLVSQNMCQRFAVDAVYIVWLRVKTQRTADGYVRANAIVDGKGYDSAGRSLGANVYKTFKITRRDFDEAVAMAEKEVGDTVGRTLTNWATTRTSGNVVSGTTVSGSSESGQGVLARNAQSQSRYVNLRLDQANEYELVEVFGKVVNTVRGVVDARRFNQRIIPDNPQACVTEWEVEIHGGTDPFRLQANIMKSIDDILDSGGTVDINGVPYRYSPSEVKLLMGIRPGEATSQSIQFVIDRERARDREFSGQHNPENSVKKSKAGFE